MSRPDTNRAASHGRGGAGNVTTRSEPATVDPVDLTTPTIKQTTYTTGRGGSGNMAANDNPDIARAAQDVDTPAHHKKNISGTHHWGRGGEGNMMTFNDGDRAKSKERTLSKGAERRPSFSGIVEKGKDLLGLNKKEKASRANEVVVE